MKGLLIIAAGALVLGAFNLPIGYYTFLRILVCATCINILITDYKGEIGPTQIIFGIMAIFFNPLIPIYLHDKAIWKVIDLVAAVVFVVKALSSNPIKTSKPNT
jgi:hypothetical protein